MSIGHWGLVLIAAFLLLGRGKFAALMGEMGQSLKSFRKELRDDSLDRTTDHSAE